MKDLAINSIGFYTSYSEKIAHPGEMLQCELIQRRMSQKDLSEIIGKTTPVINDIIKGKRDINVEISVLLESVFPNIKAEQWLKWQNDYDLQQVRESKHKELTSIATWNTLNEILNLNYLKKKLKLGKNIDDNINQIFSYLGISSIEELQHKNKSICSFFKKSEALKTNYINLMTWIAIVRHMSESQQINNTFDFTRVDNLVEQLHSILYKNVDTIAEVRNVLNKYGIKFVEEKNLEKMPVDGYSFWEGNNPTIVITKRIKRIDNLAYVLFHELGHICLHLIEENNRTIDFVNVEYNSKDKDNLRNYEEEANKFATEKIWGAINHKLLFSKINNPYSATNYLISISETLKINPAIIAGQFQFYCHENKICANAYSVCHKLIQNIN